MQCSESESTSLWVQLAAAIFMATILSNDLVNCWSQYSGLVCSPIRLWGLIKSIVYGAPESEQAEMIVFYSQWGAFDGTAAPPLQLSEQILIRNESHLWATTDPKCGSSRAIIKLAMNELSK